jgi:hypothetical protein
MQATSHYAETTANFIAAMGAAATGVSVVTTEGLAGRFGLTVSAISSVSTAHAFGLRQPQEPSGGRHGQERSFCRECSGP